MEDRTHWATMVHLVAPHRRLVAVMGLLLAIAGALPLVGPLIIARFIDDATAGVRTRWLIILAALYVGAGLCRQLLSILVARTATDLAWRVTNELRSQLARHVLDLDLGFHRSTSPGELVSRVDGDVSALSEFISHFAAAALAAAVTLIGIVAIVFWQDWRIGMAITLYLSVAVLAVYLLRNTAVDKAALELAAFGQMFGEMEERFAGADDLRSNGGGSHAVATFQTICADVLRSFLGKERRGVMLWILSNAVFVTGGLLMLALDAALLQRGAITLGTAYLLFQYTQILREPLNKLADETERVQRAAGGMVRTLNLLDQRTSIIDVGQQSPPPGALSVDFDAVRFEYDDEEEPVRTLHDVCLSLRPGSSIGVLGRTGSGKTTLARLLLRLIEPTSGTISMGGVRLEDLALSELRRRTGVVSQDVHLFGASIRDNLTLFDETITDSELKEALSVLDLLDWVEVMPDGLGTVLGPEGAGLSAGEGQLVALTRLFLRSPDLVVLDEASSRVDPATEARVTRAIDRLIEGRTAVIIAHRLSTVERLDEVLILDAGEIVEHGAPEVLRLDSQTRYAKLLAVDAVQAFDANEVRQ